MSHSGGLVAIALAFYLDDSSSIEQFFSVKIVWKEQKSVLGLPILPRIWYKMAYIISTSNAIQKFYILLCLPAACWGDFVCYLVSRPDLLQSS